MAVEPRRVDFREFANNLGPIFDSLRREGQPILVDRDGELYKLEPQEPQGEDPWTGYDAERVRKALRASAGALHGVNREELLADIHVQRGQDSRGRARGDT